MSFESRRQENAPGAILDATTVDGERALWMAVLQRTVRDATCTVRPRHWRTDRGQGGVTVADQADARACLADVEWCDDMCERAGIDVDWFRGKITQPERSFS